MASTDPFITQRATEVQAAVASGDIEHAADLVAHLIAEEGAQGLGQVTEAINRKK
jgi:RNA polymerase-interacting CarD/CdnL/TRCF family regulator